VAAGSTKKRLIIIGCIIGCICILAVIIIPPAVILMRNAGTAQQVQFYQQGKSTQVVFVCVRNKFASPRIQNGRRFGQKNERKVLSSLFLEI